MPVRDGFSFRLAGKVYQSESLTCLYRSADMEAMATLYLLLTRDGRFISVDKVVGGKGVHPAQEWSPDRAMRFLMQHGESDIVEEFPDIFRKRAVVAAPALKPRKIAAAPKDRPAEPYLFPLQ